MTKQITTLAQRVCRNASLEDLFATLQAQRRQMVDLVIPLSRLWVDEGHLIVRGADPVLASDESGFIDPNGSYRFTLNADAQLASVLGIPVKYIRRLRDSHIELFDTNVNSWAIHPEFTDKKVLVRLLWGTNPDNDDGTVGIVRAVLSDRYGARDNFDTLVAVLDGLRAKGLNADNLTIQGNLSDDRMNLFVEAPELFVNAPELLGTYSPPAGIGVNRHQLIQPGRHEFIENTIHAGIAISNSETGGGAMAVTPRVVVLKCMNGWQITKDAFRKIHVGAKLDEGAIVWSGETRDAANALAREQVKDAVSAFLNVDYVQKVVDEIADLADVRLPRAADAIEAVAQKMAYTQDEAAGILDHFIQGHQVTAGGVLQAVTSFAQTVEDPERSFDLEAGATQALAFAAAVGKEAAKN